jgi:hypothetical protein
VKKILIVAALLLVPAAFATADDDVGCGLGTQLWAGNEGLAPKVLAATTNGTSGNQTFGITTGTLGCSQEGVITADARLRMFAGANLDNLARDMAGGQGETLDAFASLMEVTEDDKPVFFAFTRSNFTVLFSDDDVTAGQMLAKLNTLMAQNAELSVYAQS